MKCYNEHFSTLSLNIICAVERKILHEISFEICFSIAAGFRPNLLHLFRDLANQHLSGYIEPDRRLKGERLKLEGHAVNVVAVLAVLVARSRVSSSQMFRRRCDLCEDDSYHVTHTCANMRWRA